VAVPLDARTAELGEDLASCRRELLSKAAVSEGEAADLESKYKVYSTAVLNDAATAAAAAAARGGGTDGGPHPHADEYHDILEPVRDLLNSALNPQQNQPVMTFHCFDGRIVTCVCDHCERPDDDTVKVCLRPGDTPIEVQRSRTLANLSFSDQQLWHESTVPCIKEAVGNHEYPELAFMQIMPIAGFEQLVAASGGALRFAPVLRADHVEHLRGMCILGSAGYGIATLHLFKGSTWYFANGAEIRAPSTNIGRYVFRATCAAFRCPDSAPHSLS